MVDSLSGLFAALIFITVALTAFSIGLATAWPALLATIRRVSFAYVLLVNLLVIPLVGWLLVEFLELGPEAATGVLLCSICAAGPVALKASQIARSDLAWALSLTVILLSTNVVSLPVWSSLLFDQALVLNPGDLIGVLVLAIMCPVLGGMWWGSRSPRAQRLSSGATSISNITLVAAIGVGIAGNLAELVRSLGTTVFIASLTIIAIAGVSGWSVPDTPQRRRASSLATLNRATSVALLVVGRAFPDQAEVFIVVVVFGLVQTAAALGVASYWRWLRPAGPVSVPAQTSGA